MLFEHMFESLVMSRNYGATPRSLVRVRVDDRGFPTQFGWRGRRYVVVAVLLTWLESSAWWRRNSYESRDWRVWRVEAAADRSESLGVYDISTSDDRWFVRRVMD